MLIKSVVKTPLARAASGLVMVALMPGARQPPTLGTPGAFNRSLLDFLR